MGILVLNQGAVVGRHLTLASEKSRAGLVVWPTKCPQR